MYVALFIVIAIGAVLLFHARQRLKLQISKRESAEQALVDVTETLGCGVYQLREKAAGELTVVFANPAARRFAGLPENGVRVSGGVILGRIHPDDRARLRRAALRSLRTGAALSEACRLQMADGSWAWIVNDASAQNNEDGSRTWSGFMADLTAEKTLNQSLRELLEQKREFVVTAGQELRAPIHTLSLAAQSLLTRELTTVQRRSLTQADRLAVYLGKYIDGLLQLSRLDAGEEFIDSRPVDLRRTFAAVMSSIRADNAFEELAFSYQEEGDLPGHVYLDTDRFRRLLACLIESLTMNRLQQSIVIRVEQGIAPHGHPGGGPELTGPEAHADCWLRLKLHVPRRPGPAHDSDESHARLEESALALRNLNLAIAGRLVSAWGGVFEPALTTDVETICCATVPLRLASATQVGDVEQIAVRKSATIAPLPGRRDAAALGAGTAARILFVDDDKTSRILLASMLREEGFDVDEAGSAEQGLERLAGRNIDIVILDNQMPGMSGLEMAGQIRRTRVGGDCPYLIGMTGGIADQDVDAARLAFDRVLIKPVNVAGLLAILHNVVRRPHGRALHV